MDFSKAYQHLSVLYNELNAQFIRTSFVYNNHRIYLYYLNPDKSTDMLHLYINSSGVGKNYSVFCNFNFVHKENGPTTLNPFFPKNEYNALKRWLFSRDAYSPTPLFEHIRGIIEAADKTVFVSCEYGEISRHRGSANVKTSKDSISKSYFQTLRQSNMSIEMEKRIKSNYHNADKIIAFLRKNKKTLVFTDDFERRRDFYAYLDENLNFRI